LILIILIRPGLPVALLLVPGRYSLLGLTRFGN
jgi:hypothetical protein